MKGTVRILLVFAAGLLVGGAAVPAVTKAYRFGPAFPSNMLELDIGNDSAAKAYAAVINIGTRGAAVFRIDPGSTRRIRVAAGELDAEIARQGVIVVTFNDEGLAPLHATYARASGPKPAFLKFVPEGGVATP